ncbi:T9SS type A sorting domain-containing protein [Flavobacterium sp. W22_SRS_FK3]|uniref:T9SS type A sorting domain-containing protein n=1 Tax=Flavobacterium sp. W22_SRS_FK3 TaxID=3240275 RepID=UPI003F90C10C
MKRKLLYLTTVLLFSVGFINAQTTVWDFGNSTSSINGGNSTASWSITAAGVGTIGADTDAVLNKLGLYSNSPTSLNDIVNFGAVNNSAPADFTSVTDGESYAGQNRFQLNGGGSPTAGTFVPTQRYLYFNVDGACTVKVWFKTGSNGTARTIVCTNGAVVLGSGTSNSGGTGDLVVFTATITAQQAAVGKIYIYADGSTSNLYKIQVSGANVTTPSLGVNDFQADASSNVYSNGKSVFVSNVKSDTQVDVYGISGALVKSFKTGADTSFDLNTGLYVVRSKSAEGEKTAKVLVN